jgi:hypothetical protein
MSITLPYQEFSFEEIVINKTSLQIIVTVCDKESERSRIVFEKTIPFLLFVPIFVMLGILAFPFLILAFVIEQIMNLKKEDAEMSYEEAKKYFEDGNGYFNNLSDEGKRNMTKSISRTLG